jgi:hypothetical protein
MFYGKNCVVRVRINKQWGLGIRACKDLNHLVFLLRWYLVKQYCRSSNYFILTLKKVHTKITLGCQIQYFAFFLNCLTFIQEINFKFDFFTFLALYFDDKPFPLSEISVFVWLNNHHTFETYTFMVIFHCVKYNAS